MKYAIFGENLPAVSFLLDAGESIYTQSGGMAWMSDGISMETNTRGGIMKGLGRMLSGESLFMATYTSQTAGQELTIASSFPGQILTLNVGSGQEYICQKNAFLCAQHDVELSTVTAKKASGMIFGGEGFFLQHLSGRGMAFLEIDGSVKEINLAPGQRIKVSTGNLAAFESTVSYTAETIKGFKNVLFGGEGMFLTILTGPGKVWLQTMTISGLAAKMIPYLPNKSS